MQKRTLQIHHAQGIHLTVASSVVTLLKKYPTTQVYFQKGTHRVNARSVLSVLSLNVTPDVPLDIEVHDDKAEDQETACLDALCHLLTPKTRPE